MRILFSPNQNERKNGVKPSFLIMHYTGTKSAQEAEDYYIGAGQASPHFMIEEDGTVTQFVPLENRAWHAGVAYWNGITDLNSHSIGIECVNPGHEFGYRPFPAVQMEALAALSQDLIRRFDIPSHQVLGHSDIAVARTNNPRLDPGELFDWAFLAERGVGVYPTESCAESLDGSIKDALISYGYDPSASEEALITAFQRHFMPEAFEMPEMVGKPSLEVMAKIKTLLALKV